MLTTIPYIEMIAAMKNKCLCAACAESKENMNIRAIKTEALTAFWIILFIRLELSPCVKNTIRHRGRRDHPDNVGT